MIYKAYITTVLTLILAAGFSAQEIYTPLATMSGRSFTAQDLQPGISNAWLKLPETLKKARSEFLDLQIDEVLLNQEAAKRNISVESLLEAEVIAKVPDPDEKAIKAIYDQNKASIGNTPLESIKPQIISYLRFDLEKAAKTAYSSKLRAAAKIEVVKDINAERLVSKDVLTKVNDEPITLGLYTKRNGLAVYEFEADVYDQVNASLRLIVDAAVYTLEAQERSLPVNELIANEITSKMKDFSVDEQQRLEGGLRDGLYKKFRVQFFLKEPVPFIQHVSADDDPFIGKAAAPVTIVVFADYECPACAGIHPLIKELAAKYGDKVRLVFRDFPLTDKHEFAFGAALAANAAKKQGKFFEYSDSLYRNQEDLDLASLKKYAAELKLNLEQFSVDMTSAEAADEVRKDIQDGRDYGVNGTPSIFVNGYKVRTLSIAAFKDAIERALAGKFQVIR